MPLSSDDFTDLNDMLAAIEAERGGLSDWERGFYDDQVTRVAKYGADTNFSPKQWAALKRIYNKATGNPDDEGR